MLYSLSRALIHPILEIIGFDLPLLVVIVIVRVMMMIKMELMIIMILILMRITIVMIHFLYSQIFIGHTTENKSKTPRNSTPGFINVCNKFRYEIQEGKIIIFN